MNHEFHTRRNIQPGEGDADSFLRDAQVPYELQGSARDERWPA